MWKKTGCSPSFMPKLFIALKLRVDIGNLSKIEEAVKEGFEVKQNGPSVWVLGGGSWELMRLQLESWLFFMVVPMPNLTMDVWILEGDFVGSLNFITSKTISS